MIYDSPARYPATADVTLGPPRRSRSTRHLHTMASPRLFISLPQTKSSQQSRHRETINRVAAALQRTTITVNQQQAMRLMIWTDEIIIDIRNAMSSFVIAGRKDIPVFVKVLFTFFYLRFFWTNMGAISWSVVKKTHEGRSTIQLIEIC